MKGRYVIMIGFLSVVINGVSLYNMLLGYISLFICLIVLIPNVFIKIIEWGNKESEKGRNSILVQMIQHFGKERHSKGIYIFGMIFVSLTGIGLGIFQIYQYDYIHYLVQTNITLSIYYTFAPYLVTLGYLLFAFCLIVMFVHFNKLFKEANIFQEK